VRRKNEIVVIPVTTIVRQGNTTTPVHGDLPRANRFIKNTRDQRASDLPARITPLTQPDCQEIYHVISELSDRRKRPVPEHRADMRAQNALIRLLRQFRACVTAYPLLAFIPEPRATQLGIYEHPRPLVVRDLYSDPDEPRRMPTCDNCHSNKDPPIWTVLKSGLLAALSAQNWMI